VVVVVLALILGCDPTGNIQVPAGDGAGAGLNPALVGAWRNVHLEGSYDDGNILRVTTTWRFEADADCARDAETYSLAEDVTFTSRRECTWRTDGRVLGILYTGAPDTVSYIFEFPTSRGDTLSLGGIRFAHVGP
jgi:hypothetical protein